MPATRAKRPVREAKQSRAKATVEAIMEAAAQILSRDGLASLNTNAIARRAGVSVGSVYEYFPNKQAIIDRLLDRHLQDGEEALRQGASALPSTPTPRDIVHALVDGAVRLHQSDPQLHRVLSTVVPLSAGQIKRVEALREGLIGVVQMALAPHVIDPAIKATILVDTVDALTHRWLVDEVGTPVAPEQMSRELEGLLCAYIAAGQQAVIA